MSPTFTTFDDRNILHKVLAMTVPFIDERASPSCDDLRNCRTIWNIIWGCVVTLFACTWVAIHPNIPKSNVQWYSEPLRRARIMLYALIGPEFIISWAWRQRNIASKRSHILKDWSRVHGFFAAMGGFVLDDDEDNPPRTLCFEEIVELARNDEIEYPIITEAEIKDKSKGDVVTKGLVLIQTIWFLLQCIARAKQRLAITEFEVATVAFALLNLITYALWWDKPLNVKCPVRVRRKHVCGQEAGRERARGKQEANQDEDPEIEEHQHGGFRRNVWGYMWKAVKTTFFAVFGPFCSMLKENEDDGIFFAGRNEDQRELEGTFGGFWLVATIFGGIHCIAWSFSFPSSLEQCLWRICSIVITVTPLAIQGSISVLLIEPKRDTHIADVVIFSVLLYPLSILYTLARVTLLVLSPMALRSLPQSALQTVHWTTFLPHV